MEEDKDKNEEIQKLLKQYEIERDEIALSQEEYLANPQKYKAVIGDKKNFNKKGFKI